MAKERNEHSRNHANKKHIEWIIKIITKILVIISLVISIVISICKELFALTTILLLFLLICVIVLLHKEKKENKRLKKETCKNCKTVYFYGADVSISFSESFDKHAFPFPYYEGDDDNYMVDYNRIYYLEDYLFISFHDEDSEEKCYLINLINGLIYLPVDNNGWKCVLGNRETLYRQLCSKRRTNHFNGIDQLI